MDNDGGLFFCNPLFVSLFFAKIGFAPPLYFCTRNQKNNDGKRRIEI